jgi:hypothetical protein
VLESVNGAEDGARHCGCGLYSSVRIARLGQPRGRSEIKDRTIPRLNGHPAITRSARSLPLL